MAGKFKVKTNTKPVVDNTVSGNTLEEIWEALRKKALACSDAVGMAVTDIKTPNVNTFTEEKAKKGPKKKGNEAWIVAGKPGEVLMTVTITLPKLSSDKNLSKAAKKEWKRFRAAVSAHEDLHVDVATKLAETIAQELTDMRGHGEGKTKDAAIAAAVADYTKQYKKAYGGTKIAERVKKTHAALDSKGNTFTLDINID
ncbi:MAG: DUF922 domain-containing protein [Arenibacterium sp.]